VKFVLGLILFFLSGVFCEASPRQESRFQKPIRNLQRSLNKKDLDLVIDSLIQNANRTDLFQLEALLRVYENEYPETLEGFLKDDIKPFEDELGKLIDLTEAIGFSEAVDAPREVIAYLKGKTEAQRESLKTFLKDHEFVGRGYVKSPLGDLQKSLKETEWAGKKTDRKDVLKSFRALFKEIIESDYDMKALETGLHEFRRDLRWVPIYLRSFPDLFKLDNRKLPEAKISPDDPVFKSPYSKIPRPKDAVSFPLLFPKIGLVALNKVIEQLGKVKNTGKMEELLTHTLKESGVASTALEAKRLAKELVKKHPGYIPVTKTANQVYRAFKDEDHGLAQALNQILKEQKSWNKRDCKAFLESLGK